MSIHLFPVMHLCALQYSCPPRAFATHVLGSAISFFVQLTSFALRIHRCIQYSISLNITLYLTYFIFTLRAHRSLSCSHGLRSFVCGLVAF